MSAPATPDPATSASAAPDTAVLIVGAGPTGLVLALWLTQLGIRVRLIDKATQPGANSRALAVQARTLELYSQLDLAAAVVERGRHVTAVNFWASGKQVTHAVFASMGAGLSPFPFALVFPQDEHERLLVDRLAALGVAVERQTELLGFDDAGGHILARLQLPGGAIQTCTASFIAGCDGAHSVVRQSLHIGFPGGEYTHLFYVADVQASGVTTNGELHVGLDKADFLAVFPFPEAGRVRLVGTVRDPLAEQRRDQLSWQDVSQRVIDWIRIDVQHVNWFSTYRVHHRVAEHFRHQRAFLLGDAAHIHSPVGGQGMNTGIGDAINLAWKLAAVLHNHANPAILDTYEPERIAFARRLVATTDRAFTAVTSTGALARLLRLHIVPFFLPSLFRFGAIRRFMFRTVSQIAVNYRGSRLSQGRAGRVHGGDRLPWVLTEPEDDPLGNFAPLSSLNFQVHIYGNVTSAIRTLCERRHLPLHLFPWRRGMSHAGLRPNALYLLRPDGYIALVDPEASPTRLVAFLDAHGLAPAS